MCPSESTSMASRLVAERRRTGHLRARHGGRETASASACGRRAAAAATSCATATAVRAVSAAGRAISSAIAIFGGAEIHHRRSSGLCSYGVTVMDLHSYCLHGFGIYSYGLCSYGLCSCVLYSYGRDL